MADDNDKVDATTTTSTSVRPAKRSRLDVDNDNDRKNEEEKEDKLNENEEDDIYSVEDNDDDDDDDDDDDEEHEIIDIDDDEDDDDDDDDEDEDEESNNSKASNKAKSLLSNFKAEEIVKDAKHDLALLHSIHSFANDLKLLSQQQISQQQFHNRANTYTMQLQLQQQQHTEQERNSKRTKLILECNGCTQCERVFEQKGDVLCCSCLRETLHNYNAAVSTSSSSATKQKIREMLPTTTGEQLCQQCVEEEKGIVGTCWYCFRPICEDCDYINCEGDECTALSCVSCNNNRESSLSAKMNSKGTAAASAESFKSCACGDSFYCPDCCSEYMANKDKDNDNNNIDDTYIKKNKPLFGTLCDNCEVLLECCNDTIVPNFTCVECNEQICEKCKFKFKCGNTDVVCENCMGMDYEHDCEICIGEVVEINDSSCDDEEGEEDVDMEDDDGREEKKGKMGRNGTNHNNREEEKEGDFDGEEDEGDY